MTKSTGLDLILSGWGPFLAWSRGQTRWMLKKTRTSPGDARRVGPDRYGSRASGVFCWRLCSEDTQTIGNSSCAINLLVVN